MEEFKFVNSKLEGCICKSVRTRFPFWTRVSQFRLKKNFASKQNLAKQKTGFALFRFNFANPQKSFTSFCFVLLSKFRFVSLKKRFVSDVSL